MQMQKVEWKVESEKRGNKFSLSAVLNVYCNTQVKCKISRTSQNKYKIPFKSQVFQLAIDRKVTTKLLL